MDNTAVLKPIGLRQPPKVSWNKTLNRMYEMAKREDNAVISPLSPDPSSMQLSLLTSNKDRISPLMSPDSSSSSMQLSLGAAGAITVNQNVFVTSSQQISATDSGMIRTTSQQFKTKTVQVQSVVSSSTHSIGDLHNVLNGDKLALPGIGGKIGGSNKEINLSPVSPGSTSIASNSLVPVGQQQMSETDLAIEATLSKTMETFQNMLQKQREQFMQMFPQFKNMRAECEPEITTETIVQPDGTILVIEKQQSRRVMQFNQKTTIINGVVQSTTTRAVMVYGGPKKGYEIKMEEVETTPVDSETEDDEDRVSLAPSEYMDTESPVVRLDDGIHEISTAAKKKLEKAWCAAEELVETERRYVAKLHLLASVFRPRVEQMQDSRIANEKISKLFSNVAVILQFHTDTLLPKLEDRLREWHDTQKMCDVINKYAPFLKMYSEYTNNYKKASKVFDELKRKNKRFAAIVCEIEAMPECDNLPLNSHLICPVQRVARYHLLMQEYLKNLPERHADRKDAESALENVKVAAAHANEMMKKLDKYKDVIEVQESLGSQIQGLVTPTRELIKKGQLTKISGRTGDRQDRVLFLFDDLLLLCSDRRVVLTKYKLRAVFSVEDLLVLEGDNLELENTFYIRSKNKAVELQAKTTQEKTEWMETLWSVVQNHKTRIESFSKPVSSPLSSPSIGGGDNNRDSAVITNGNQKCCAKCQATFKFLTKEYVCHNCESSVCKKCCKKALSPDGKEKVLTCVDCSATDKDQKSPNGTSPPVNPKDRRKSMLAVKPEDDCVWKGPLEFRSAKSSWTPRYFALHSDFVLYCFKNEKDTTARTSLLIPSCKISLVDPKQDSFVSGRDIHVMFKLTHQNRVYYFKTSDETDMVKWMAALDLASKAELPKKSPSETESI